MGLRTGRHQTKQNKYGKRNKYALYFIKLAVHFHNNPDHRLWNPVSFAESLRLFSPQHPYLRDDRACGAYCLCAVVFSVLQGKYWGKSDPDPGWYRDFFSAEKAALAVFDQFAERGKRRKKDCCFFADLSLCLFYIQRKLYIRYRPVSCTVYPLAGGIWYFEGACQYSVQSGL